MNPLSARIYNQKIVADIKSLAGIQYQQELDGSICVRSWVLDAVNEFFAANHMSTVGLRKYLEVRAKQLRDRGFDI